MTHEGNIPPTTSYWTDAFWRNLFNRVRQIVDEEMVAKLGSMLSGGKISGGSIGGTVAPGAWSPMAVEGDIIYQHGGVPTRLPIGSEGDVLTVVGGYPVWQAGGGTAGAILTDDSGSSLVDDSGSVLLGE